MNAINPVIKKRYILQISLIMILLVSLQPDIQGQDTLRNYKKDSPLIAYKSLYQSDTCGYITGQNCFLSEIYAEKYRIKGSASVDKIIGHFQSSIIRPNRSLRIDIYSVGSNHLPNVLLGSEILFYGELNNNINPVLIEFEKPVLVTDSFFVACNFLNYAHEQFSDTIGLMTTINNQVDKFEFGKNALRNHHGGWEDLYEFTKLNVSLALLPIINYEIRSISNETYRDQSVSVYPNPSSDNVNLTFNTLSPKTVKIEIIDLAGIVIYSELYFKEAGIHNHQISLGAIPLGQYLISFLTNDSHIVKLITKSE